MPDQISIESVALGAAEKISSMADKVTGFAISSNLLLTFSCLKDLQPWAQNHPDSFLIGIPSGAFVYIASVWRLYFQEIHIRQNIQSSQATGLLKDVSRSLAWARTGGLVIFAIIACLAVIAASNGATRTALCPYHGQALNLTVSS